MRIVTFGGANSLDNYIARKNDEVDWLLWSKEVSPIVRAYWKTIDTVVMGRKTYQAALKVGTSSYSGIKTYVFSRTLKQSGDEKVEIISQDAAEFVRKLKEEKGKGICVMGGGVLGKSLLEAGLIDELGCNIHPVLLGSGIPLFHKMKRQIDLELIKCQTFKNGCVLVTYRVKR